jgi:hypothetical protein
MPQRYAQTQVATFSALPARVEMPRVLSAYGDLMDGFRSWYARKEGDNPYAAFSVVSLMTTLLLANLWSTFALVDLLLYPGIFQSEYEYRALIVLPSAVVLMALHMLFAKKTGIYDRHGGPRSESWSRSAALYVTFTVTYLVFVLAGVALRRYLHSGGHAV